MYKWTLFVLDASSSSNKKLQSKAKLNCVKRKRKYFNAWVMCRELRQQITWNFRHFDFCFVTFKPAKNKYNIFLISISSLSLPFIVSYNLKKLIWVIDNSVACEIQAAWNIWGTLIWSRSDKGLRFKSYLQLHEISWNRQLPQWQRMK